MNPKNSMEPLGFRGIPGRASFVHRGPVTAEWVSFDEKDGRHQGDLAVGLFGKTVLREKVTLDHLDRILEVLIAARASAVQYGYLRPDRMVTR